MILFFVFLLSFSTPFNNNEKSRIYTIFKTINSSVKVQKIRKLTSLNPKDEYEIEIVLSDIREVIKSEQVNLVYKPEAESEQVSIPKLSKEITPDRKVEKKKIQGLTLDRLNDKIGNANMINASKLPK